jgi:hypothetical protein
MRKISPFKEAENRAETTTKIFNKVFFKARAI